MLKITRNLFALYKLTEHSRMTENAGRTGMQEEEKSLNVNSLNKSFTNP